MATVGLVGIGLDPTERYKFNSYAQTGLTALWTVHLLFDAFSEVRHTSLRFVVGFGVENGFVLLMAFFHWPCSNVSALTLGKEDGVDEDPELFVNPEGGQLEERRSIFNGQQFLEDDLRLFLAGV